MTKKEIVIETGASKDGLGAYLLQEGHPVAFASRSLTSTEQKYAQIEKAMLAIVFAIQKIHYFVYGLKVNVNSDHKPLDVIFKKDLANISPRLQRMRLRLLNYNLVVSYKPGKYLNIADTLSRAFLSDKDLMSDEEFNFAIHSVVKNLPMSEDRRLEFENALANDLLLSTVVDFCLKGWPDNKSDIPDRLRQYFKISDSLSFSNGLLLFTNKVKVPESLRKNMLKLLHEGHVGIEKAKSRARQIFYCPSLNIDIESYIKACRIWESFARKQERESLCMYPVPQRPWERVGIDIFSYADKRYLVNFYSFSNW